MSDEIRQRGQKLVDDVVKDIKGRQGTLSKLKEMTKLAKEIDPEFDTKDIDDMLDVSETVSKNILDKLDRLGKK